MYIVYLIVLLLLGCSQNEFPWEEATFSEAKSIASDANKIIMIDFYADW